MSYDPEVAERVRRVLADQAGVAEKKMVGGGLSFVVNGNMCCGVRGRALMVRVGAAGRQQALSEPHVRPMLQMITASSAQNTRKLKPGSQPQPPSPGP